MPKISSVFVCQQCGMRFPQFLGRCPECGSWNSLVEEVEKIVKKGRSEQRKVAGETAKIIQLSDLKKDSFDRLSTKIEEFDRVLGGGIVKGSLSLVSGDPGVGKSTLLSQLALNIKDTLYIAGEESAQQISLRTNRIKNGVSLKILQETDIDLISQVIEREKPPLVIVDSIQTLETADLASPAGSVSQVRECAHRLQQLSKLFHISIFLVGHITKEGTVAGPKTLEHLVDTLVSLEGDELSTFRVLRANKNRFGPSDEVGIFEMAERGLIEVKNPSRVFLEQKINAPGSAVSSLITGMRPLLIEIQALVTKSALPIPRRVGAGVDLQRLQLLIAVLTKRLNLSLFDQDIFVNLTGGIKVMDPAIDLGVSLAIFSSFKNQQIKPKTLLVGEVGLLGEVRSVRNLDKRLREAKKLGFSNILGPHNVKSLAQAVKLALI